MKFNTQHIKEVLAKKGYDFFDKNKAYNLNIIGVRSNNDIANSFDDWLYLIFRDDHLNEQSHEFSITTDPGCDANRDTTIDKDGEIYTGIFGINIHRSNPSNQSQVVEKWSAGCQVFQKVADFNFFMNCCRKAAKIYGNSFTYTLLEEKDFNQTQQQNSINV